FALETSVRRLDGPLGELHAVRRDRHRAAAQIVGFALSDERGLDVDVWCVQALHGDIGLTAVQGAELALVAGLAGVLLALDSCHHRSHSIVRHFSPGRHGFSETFTDSGGSKVSSRRRIPRREVTLSSLSFPA